MASQLSGVTVAVVGAGLAGLAAARDLERHGAHVTVIEARDRVGGRVHTIRQDSPPDSTRRPAPT